MAGKAQTNSVRRANAGSSGTLSETIRLFLHTHNNWSIERTPATETLPRSSLSEFLGKEFRDLKRFASGDDEDRRALYHSIMETESALAALVGGQFARCGPHFEAVIGHTAEARKRLAKFDDVLNITNLRIVAVHYLHRESPSERRSIAIKAASSLFLLQECCEIVEHRIGAVTSYQLMVNPNRDQRVQEVLAKMHKFDSVMLRFFGRRFGPRMRGAPPQEGNPALSRLKTQAGPTKTAQGKRVEETFNLQRLTVLKVPKEEMKINHVRWSRMRLLVNYTDRNQQDIVVLLLANKDTLLLAGSADGSIRAYAAGDWGDGGIVWKASRPAAPNRNNAVTCLSVDPLRSRVLRGALDGAFVIHNLTTGALEHTVNAHQTSISAIEVGDECSRYFTAAVDGTVKCWEAGRLLCERTFQAHDHPVQVMMMDDPNHRLYTAGTDCVARCWQTMGKAEEKVSRFDKADGEDRFKEREGKKLWGMALGSLDPEKKKKEADDGWGSINMVKLTQLNKVLSGQDARQLPSLKLLFELKGHSAAILTVTVVAGSDTVLTAGADSKIMVWDVGDIAPKLLTTLSSAETAVTSLQIDSLGGALYAGCKDGAVLAWDMPEFEECHLIRKDPSAITSMAYNPLTRRIISAGRDGSIIAHAT